MADTKIRTRKATVMLREDHRKVKKLFQQFEKLEDGEEGEKEEIFQTIQHELTIHAQIEEEIFYPALKESGDEEMRELAVEAGEEHKVVKTLLSEISGLKPEDEAFDAKMKVLMENVKHHIEEEEGEIFKGFGKLPREEQNQVSDRLHARKMELSEGGEE